MPTPYRSQEACLKPAIGIHSLGPLCQHIAGRIGFLPREQFEPPKVPSEEHGEAVPDEDQPEENGETSGK